MAPEEKRSWRTRFPTFGKLARGLPHVGMALGFFVALLLIVSAVWNWRATGRLEKALAETRAQGFPVTGEELNLHHRSQLAGENAAKYYKAAFALMEDTEEQKVLANSLPLVSRRPFPPLGEALSPLAVQAAEQYLAGREPFFDLMGRAAARESCVFDLDFTEGADLDMSHLSSARDAARLLLLSAFVEAAHGRLDTSVERLENAFALSNHLSNEPTVLSALVRCAVCEMSVDMMERLLSTAGFGEKQLKRLQDAVASEMTPALWQNMFLGERAYEMSIFDQCLYGQDPTVVFYLLNLSKVPGYPKGIYAELGARVLRSLARGPIKNGYAAILNFYTEVIDQDSLSPRETRKWAQQTVDSEEKLERLGLSGRFVRPLVPPIVRAYDHVLKAHLYAEACETALAAERYRLDTGQMPSDLQDLVPEYIQSIPEDTFGEGALKLKQAEGEYRVYSVGYDGQDDGGAEDQDEINTNSGDVVFRVMR